MKKEDILDSVVNCYEMLSKINPLVYQITNYVAANDQANITLAAGARPIMAEHPEEINEVINQSDALLLNIGMLSKNKETILLKAAQYAKENQLPVVLDPVGIGASNLRKELVLKILEVGNVSIIKGNIGEILSLCNIMRDPGAISGVDYLANSELSFENEIIETLREFSLRYKLILVITGQEDIVIGSRYMVKLINGSSLLGKITGSGCMLGSLISSYLAVCEKPFIAAVTGLSVMAISGQLAENKSSGPGSFRVHLIDEIANFNREKLLSNIKLYIT